MFRKKFLVSLVICLVSSFKWRQNLSTARYINSPTEFVYKFPVHKMTVYFPSCSYLNCRRSETVRDEEAQPENCPPGCQIIISCRFLISVNVKVFPAKHFWLFSKLTLSIHFSAAFLSWSWTKKFLRFKGSWVFTGSLSNCQNIASRYISFSLEGRYNNVPKFGFYSFHWSFFGVHTISGYLLTVYFWSCRYWCRRSELVKDEETREENCPPGYVNIHLPSIPNINSRKIVPSRKLW